MAPRALYSSTISLLVTIGAVLALAELAFVLNERRLMTAIGAVPLAVFALATRIAGQLRDAEQPVDQIEDWRARERSP